MQAAASSYTPAANQRESQKSDRSLEVRVLVGQVRLVQENGSPPVNAFIHEEGKFEK